jgi:hypothetical protein
MGNVKGKHAFLVYPHVIRITQRRHINVKVQTKIMHLGILWCANLS